MEFRCKNFSLNHSQSSMKVGTDAILLSSFVNKNIENKTAKNILDIGTGCGIIALCMAQIFEQAEVLAIDIDRKSIDEATTNFKNNAFGQRMNAKCISLQDFSSDNLLDTDSATRQFDLIVSNPPFFTSSLQSPNKRRTNARHNGSLSLEDFVIASSKMINDNGKIAIILPEKEMTQVTSLFRVKNINPQVIMNVSSKPFEPIKRIICLFAANLSCNTKPIIQNLYIRTASNEYSEHYKELTSLFLL